MSLPECCVPTCLNNWQTTKNNVIYYRFPRNENTRQKWLAAINWVGGKPTKKHFVCADHFETKDLQTLNENTTTIVPTIFLPEFVAVKQESDNSISNILPAQSETIPNCGNIKTEFRDYIELGKYEITETPVLSDNINSNPTLVNVKQEHDSDNDDDIELDCYQIIDTPEVSDSETTVPIPINDKIENISINVTSNRPREEIKYMNGENRKLPTVKSLKDGVKLKDDISKKISSIMNGATSQSKDNQLKISPHIADSDCSSTCNIQSCISPSPRIYQKRGFSVSTVASKISTTTSHSSATIVTESMKAAVEAFNNSKQLQYSDEFETFGKYVTSELILLDDIAMARRIKYKLNRYFLDVVDEEFTNIQNKRFSFS